MNFVRNNSIEPNLHIYEYQLMRVIIFHVFTEKSILNMNWSISFRRRYCGSTSKLTVVKSSNTGHQLWKKLLVIVFELLYGIFQVFFYPNSYKYAQTYSNKKIKMDHQHPGNPFYASNRSYQQLWPSQICLLHEYPMA